MYPIFYVVNALICFQFSPNTAVQVNSCLPVLSAGVPARRETRLSAARNPILVLTACVPIQLTLCAAEQKDSAALIPLAGIVARDKIGLLVCKNAMQTIVATGVSCDLSLRATVQVNPLSPILHTGIVARDKIGLLVCRNAVQAVVATGISCDLPLCATVQVNPGHPILGTGILTCHKAISTIACNAVESVFPTDIPLQGTLRFFMQSNSCVFISLASIAARYEGGFVINADAI